MVAMAAIVAQNGATGQSLVEQFTTGVASWRDHGSCNLPCLGEATWTPSSAATLVRTAGLWREVFFLRDRCELRTLEWACELCKVCMFAGFQVITDTVWKGLAGLLYCEHCTWTNKQTDKRRIVMNCHCSWFWPKDVLHNLPYWNSPKNWQIGFKAHLWSITGACQQGGHASCLRLSTWGRAAHFSLKWLENWRVFSEWEIHWSWAWEGRTDIEVQSHVQSKWRAGFM